MRGIPGIVYWLTLAVAVVGANALILSPIAEPVAVSLGVSPASDVLRAMAAYGIGTAVGALTLAPLGDRFGADRVLAVALGVAGAAFAGIALSPSLLILSGFQTLAGLSGGAALPAAYALTAVVSPPGRGAQTMGIVLTGWTLALVGGVAVAGVVAELVGWRMVFAGMAAGAWAVSLRVAWAAIPDVPRGVSTSPLTAIGVPGLFGAGLKTVLYMIASYGLFTFAGLHMTQTLGLSTAAAGLVHLFYGMGFGGAALIAGLLDRTTPRRAMLLVFGVLTLGYLGLAVSAGALPALLAVCVIWGVANHLGLNLILGAFVALDPAQRGALTGLYAALTYLSVTASAFLYAPLFQHIGWGGAAFVSAALAAIIWVSVVRRA
ncbi:MAG: MFS transporter [Shimia sp.]